MPLRPDGAYVFRTKTWFDQTDALGILHHSHYALLIERAQKTFFVEVMGVDTIDPVVAPDVYVVVRDLELHYLAAIRPECEIDIVLRVTRVRAAGLTVSFEFRSLDGSVLYCRGSRTICRMDGRMHQPAPWTDLFRQKHEALIAR